MATQDETKHPYGLTRGSGNPAWQRAGSLSSAAKRRARSGATRTWALADESPSLLSRFQGWLEGLPARLSGMSENEYWQARMTPQERALSAWETNNEDEFIAAIRQMPTVPTQDIRAAYATQDDAALDALLAWIPDREDFQGLRDAYLAQDAERFEAILAAYPDANAHELIGRYQTEEQVLSFVGSMPAWLTGAKAIGLGKLPTTVAKALQGKGYTTAAATILWDSIKLASMAGAFTAGQDAARDGETPIAQGLDAGRQTAAFSLLARVPVAGTLLGVGTLTLMSIYEYGLDPKEAGKSAIAQAALLFALNPGNTRQNIRQIQTKLRKVFSDRAHIRANPEYAAPDPRHLKTDPDARTRYMYHKEWKPTLPPEKALATLNEARAVYKLEPLTKAQVDAEGAKAWKMTRKAKPAQPLSNAAVPAPLPQPTPAGHPYGLTRGSGNAAWQRAGTAASAARRRALARLRRQLPALARDEQGHMLRTHTTDGDGWRATAPQNGRPVPVRQYRVRFADGSTIMAEVHDEALAGTAGYLKRYARVPDPASPVVAVEYMGRTGREVTAEQIAETADVVDNLWDEFYRLHPSALNKGLAEVRSRAVSFAEYTPETLHLADIPDGLQKVDVLTKENIFHAGLTPSEKAARGRLDRGETYMAAEKGGDLDAAVRVAAEFVSKDQAKAIAAKYKGATLMPLIAAEGGGHNRLPQGLAVHIAQQGGMKMAESIMQLSTGDGSHTNKDMAHRMKNPARFSVMLSPGESVVLVDDITTSGMTLAEAAKAVEYAGGKVVGAVAFGQVSNYRTGARGDQIAIMPDTLARLERIHGSIQSFDERLRSLGIPGTRGLSDSAARYLASFKSFDAIRARFIDRGGTADPAQAPKDGPLGNRARTWLGVQIERAQARAAERRAQREGKTHKVWVTHPDEKTCPTCAALDGQTVRIGQNFAGAPNPPAHHYCRCSVRYEQHARGGATRTWQPIASRKPWPRVTLANAQPPATRPSTPPARMGSHPYGLTRGSGNAAWQRAGTLAAAARRRVLDTSPHNVEAQYQPAPTRTLRSLQRTISTMQQQGMLTEDQLRRALSAVGAPDVASLTVIQAADFARYLQSLSLVETHRAQIRTAVRQNAWAIAQRIEAARAAYVRPERGARASSLQSAQAYFDSLQRQSGVPLGDIFADLKTYRKDLDFRTTSHPDYFKKLTAALNNPNPQQFEDTDFQFTYEQIRAQLLRDGVRGRVTEADVKHNFYKSKLGDMLRALEDHVTLNESLFRDPAAVRKAVRAVTDNITMKPSQGGLLEAVGSSIYSQVALTVFNNPALAVRNLLQPLAYYTRPEELKIQRLSLNSLTPDDRAYFARQVSQAAAIKRDLLAITENPKRVGDFLPFVQELNAIADTMRLMERTDTPTRALTYGSKLDSARRAAANNPEYATDPDSLDQLVKQSGLSELSTPVQIRALEKLGSEGVDAFARYTAEAITSRVNFDYEAYARAPAAQGSSLAKAIDNLAVFARSRAQMLVQDTQKIASKSERKAAKTLNPNAQRTAIRAILGSIAGAAIADAISKELTGAKRDSYGVGETTLGLVNIGGLMYEGTSRIADFSDNALRYMMTKDPKALKRATEALPEMKSYFLPVADIMLNIYQAVAGFDHLDKYAARQLRAALDKDYKARGLDAYKVERSPSETVKEFFFGKGLETPKKKDAGRGDARTQYEKAVDSRTITLATRGERAYVETLKADPRFDKATVEKAASGDLQAAAALRLQARRPVDAQPNEVTPKP